MKTSFKFMKSGKLIDSDLELVLVKQTPADIIKGYAPGYEFEMRRSGKTTVLGTIRLRIGSAVGLRYPGHIGYEVKKRYRGHRYAVRSCQLLLPLALAHGLKALWLTVDPNNPASRKTCEILGARYVETIPVPMEHPMYSEGARFRRRYRLEVARALSGISR
jgi:predicted acetyltransferase